MGSSLQHIGDLRNMSRRLEAGYDDGLRASDERVLVESATWSGAPQEILHVWAVALEVCWRVNRHEPLPPFRRMVVAISQKLIGESWATPSRFAGPHALVVLETLIHAALSVNEPGLATRALRRWSSLINESFLSADLGPQFVGARPEAGELRAAAYLAFERADRNVAVECAEAGRMKLLSAVAGGANRVGTSTTDEIGGVGTLPASHVRRLEALIKDPAAAAMREYAKSDAHGLGLGESLRFLVSPWKRLMSIDGPTFMTAEPAAVTDDVWTSALREPTIPWIAESLTTEQLLIFPYVTREYCGAVAVTQLRVDSFMDKGEGQLLTAHEARVFGSRLADACAALYGGCPDVRIVDWDSNRTSTTQQYFIGLTMPPPTGLPRPLPAVIPSSRLIVATTSSRPAARTPVTFVGDPTLDLPGPWIEAGAWRSLFGDRSALWLGSEATKQRAIEGLCSSRLVVVSGHTIGAAGDDSFGIRLHDGELTHRDLLGLDRPLVASQVILTCCSAGTLVRERARDEMLGLVTTLLALGVRQVLAPSATVRDGASAVIGTLVAESVAAGRDLRQSSSSVLATIGAVSSNGSMTASSDLPRELRDRCPYSRVQLADRASVSGATAYETFTQFSVFGGDTIPSEHRP